MKRKRQICAPSGARLGEPRRTLRLRSENTCKILQVRQPRVRKDCYNILKFRKMEVVVFVVGGLIAVIGVLFNIVKYLNWNRYTGTPDDNVIEVDDPEQRQSPKASENMQT